MTLLRVRKEQLKIDTWIKPEAIDYCLDCWKSWMSSDSDKDLGIKSGGLLRGLKDAYGVDEDEAQQARDNRIGAATDAMIDSLIRYHQWAIYQTCGIGQVWKFPNADLATAFCDAKIALEEKLKRNVCTAVLF